MKKYAIIRFLEGVLHCVDVILMLPAFLGAIAALLVVQIFLML